MGRDEVLDGMDEGDTTGTGAGALDDAVGLRGGKNNVADGLLLY